MIKIKDTKGPGKLSSNGNFFDDIWFSGVKKLEDENEEAVYYYGPVRTIQNGFSLSIL